MDDIFDATALDFLPPFAPLLKTYSDAEASSSLMRSAQDLGFEHVMFAVIPQPRISTGDVYLRTNYPAEWRERYERQNMRAADPTVEHCFKSSAPMVWLPGSFKTAAQQSLYEEAAEFGLRVGVTLPIHGPAGEIGMLTCVRDQTPCPAFLKDLRYSLGGLALLRDVAFDAMRKYFPTAAAQEQAPQLTPREFDCLRWMTAGKTAWEIGRIMNISEAGANFHISNLRAKFNVSRRADVVLKAIRLGLVGMPD